MASMQQGVNYGPEAAMSEDLKPKPKEELAQHGEGEQPKTIGDALEEAAEKAHDKPLEVKDARAIQSAEARATGAPAGVLGGPASYAQNLMNSPQQASLGDALTSAKEYLPTDKIVTPRDAERITQAEARNDPLGQIDPHGVAASVQAASQYNVEKGFVEPAAANIPRGAAGRGRGQMQ